MLRRLIFRSSLGWVAPALMVSTAHAEQWYVQPIVSAEAESSSNVGLDSVDALKRSAVGYFADVATLIGVGTPRSDTTIRPRLVYRWYPSDSDLDRLEAFLDFNTQYTSQRSRFNMFGRYDHRDELHAETAGPDFNDVTPPSPTSPETGRIRFGATRDLALLVPTYSYNVTPRTSIGATATLQSVNYSPDDAFSHVDFTYYEGKGFVTWGVGPRTDLSIGAIGSHYDAGNIDSTSNSYGATSDLGIKWSPILQSVLSVEYQHVTTDRTEPEVFKGDSNIWGAVVVTTYKAQISTFTLDVGRSVTPSGSGGLYNSDHAKFGLKHDLSQRWQLNTAVQYIHDTAVTRDVSGNNRDYGRGDIAVRWRITPTWFSEAGYSYIYQKYKSDPSNAMDNSVYLRFGYQGLPPQR